MALSAGVTVEWIPLVGHEYVLLDYWKAYLHDWAMDPDNCLRCAQKAKSRMQLYAAYATGGGAHGTSNNNIDRKARSVGALRRQQTESS